MAGCTGFTCDHCGFSVDFWDDSNRYLKWPPGPGTTCITRAISLRPRNLCRRSMDGRLPLRNIPKLSKATAVTRANFCANSVPASVASIQKGIVKSARCAAPHLSDIPADLLKRSARNVRLVILIVVHPAGSPEYQVLGALFTAPLNDDAAAPKALQNVTDLRCLAKTVKHC